VSKLSLTSESRERTPSERLWELADAVRRRWLAAALVLGFTLVGAAAVTAVQHKYYKSTAQILLQPNDKVQSTINPGSIASQADAAREVTTYTQMITVEPVAAAVQRQLGLHVTLPRLVERISVSGAETSNLVSITARDPNPVSAAQLATAFAIQYQNYRREIALQQINAALQAARENAQAKFAGSAVAARVTQLEAAAASETGGVQIIRPAIAPRSPASPSMRSTMSLGLVVGILLALAAVLGMEAFDRRLLAPAQFEAAFGAPVLAVLRHVGRSRRITHQQAARRRAYAELAARLAFTDAAEGCRAIMVSAARGAMSANAFAHGLAEALGALGRRVALVEADLGAGTEERRSGAGDRGGLTAVLNGRSTFGRELTDVHLVAESTARKHELESRASVSYSTLPSGPRVAEPETLLGRPVLQDVLAEAKERGDLVLVATATLDQPSCVLPLARLCDGVIVVALEGSINADDAREIVSLLSATGIQILGIVLDQGVSSAQDASSSGHRESGIVGWVGEEQEEQQDLRGHPLATAGLRDARG
jgi:polysaccharide biosynthesis transport protein